MRELRLAHPSGAQALSRRHLSIEPAATKRVVRATHAIGGTRNEGPVVLKYVARLAETIDAIHRGSTVGATSAPTGIQLLGDFPVGLDIVGPASDKHAI